MAEGELIAVKWSEWAAPVVVAHKKYGRIRICGDFKVSINPVIDSYIYPLRTPEEMFSMITNGESYTDLNLARAYKQMALTKECRCLLTINTHLIIQLWAVHKTSIWISTVSALWQQAMG